MLTLVLSVLILRADTVTGRVVDNAGQPVPQAIVEITQLGKSVTAGADGAFRVALAPGRYTLAVRRHGFAPAVREISVGAGQAALEIVLTPSAFNLEPVTVTATRQPLASASSPLPSSALAGDELRQAQSVSLAHVVEALPGVRAITTGSQIGKPVIRGFSGPRVLVLENGSRLEDYSWSDEDGPSVETAFVRRVELIGGPASVLYGSDAGSALSVRLVHYGGEFKLLEANAPPGETGGPERKAGDERLQITGQRPWGTWRVEGKGQLQFHSLIEVADDTTGTESEQFNLLLQTGSLDLLLHHGGTTFGIAMVGQRNDASGREPIVPNANVLSSAAFAFEQWSPGSGRWTLLAGLRADFRRLIPERNDSLGVVAQDRSNQAWSGNAGGGFTPVPGGALSLSLNVGRAWRAPTLFELFANGPHIGEARYELGDSTMKPE